MTDPITTSIQDYLKIIYELTEDSPAASTNEALLSHSSVLSEALARALFDLGLRPGDIISFQTPNWVEAAVIPL